MSSPRRPVWAKRARARRRRSRSSRKSSIGDQRRDANNGSQGEDANAQDADEEGRTEDANANADADGEGRQGQESVLAMAKKNFIAGAIKRPGQLHKDLGVPAGKPIPAKLLDEAAKRPGKVGQRARFAKTLKGMN